MKIWIFNNYNTLPQHGQFCRHYNFGKYLQKAGHKPVVFAGSHPHNTNIQLIQGRRKYAICEEAPFPWVLVKTCNYESSKLKRIWSMFEYYYNAKKAAKQFDRPDAVIGSSAHPLAALLAIRLGRKYHCKGIVEVRDLWPESIVAYGILSRKNPVIQLLYHFEKYLYAKADAIIFTMEGGRDYIVEQGWDLDHGGPIDLNKTHYINNGVDMEEFDYNREHFKIADADLDDPEIFKVIYTGSIRRVNNLGLILDAAKEVTDPRVKFLIWGDGDELPALRMRVVDEGIANVVFKGRVEKKYIPDIVSRADLTFAHNSPSPLFRYGISFNKLFDCFAAGKPVLTDFSCRYNPTLQTGAGANVEQSTAQAVAEKIVEFAAMDREIYEGFCRNARKAAEDYDFKILTQKLISVIEGVSAK